MGHARRQKNVTAHQEKKQTTRSTDNPNVGVSRQGLSNNDWNIYKNRGNGQNMKKGVFK